MRATRYLGKNRWHTIDHTDHPDHRMRQGERVVTKILLVFNTCVGLTDANVNQCLYLLYCVVHEVRNTRDSKHVQQGSLVR
jgi:hypothetical protein